MNLERARTVQLPRLARLFRGGTEGNRRLTATTAAVLLVLLAAEGLTIPGVRAHLTLHVFLGMLLIPPVALKMASSAWRFGSYYLRRPEYLKAGPPAVLLRIVVAPFVVASTIVLFGTGVLLIATHPHGGIVLGLHKASFVVWFFSMSAHVLAHVAKIPGAARADLSRALPGSGLRQLLLAVAIVAGVVVALATLPEAHAWSHWASLQRQFGDH